jgi:protease I
MFYYLFSSGQAWKDAYIEFDTQSIDQILWWIGYEYSLSLLIALVIGPHFIANNKNEKQEIDMELKGKKVAIPVENLFNTFEFWYPYYRLKEAGAEVIVVGSGSSETYTGKPGTEVKVDVSIDMVSVADFDGIVIPGGYAPDIMRRYPKMVQLVKDLFEGGKVVAAICHAGWMLASAEILKGRTVTSFFAIKDDLVHAGAKWVDEKVVVDGNLITSRMPDDLPAFMKAVIDKMK